MQTKFPKIKSPDQETYDHWKTLADNFWIKESMFF